MIRITLSTISTLFALLVTMHGASTEHEQILDDANPEESDRVDVYVNTEKSDPNASRNDYIERTPNTVTSEPKLEIAETTPGSAAKQVSRDRTLPNEDFEVEMLKQINSRLRNEIEEKSKTINESKHQSDRFDLIFGASIVFVGLFIGFYVGYRTARNKRHL